MDDVCACFALSVQPCGMRLLLSPRGPVSSLLIPQRKKTGFVPRGSKTITDSGSLKSSQRKPKYFLRGNFHSVALVEKRKLRKSKTEFMNTIAIRKLLATKIATQEFRRIFLERNFWEQRAISKKERLSVRPKANLWRCTSHNQNFFTRTNHHHHKAAWIMSHFEHIFPAAEPKLSLPSFKLYKHGNRILNFRIWRGGSQETKILLSHIQTWIVGCGIA